MPYISQNQREEIDGAINALVAQIVDLENCKGDETVDRRNLDGVLNYTVTRLLHGVLDIRSRPRYTKFNTALGVLEGIKLELYRRLVGPYENIKIEENGDV